MSISSYEHLKLTKCILFWTTVFGRWYEHFVKHLSRGIRSSYPLAAMWCSSRRRHRQEEHVAGRSTPSGDEHSAPATGRMSMPPGRRACRREEAWRLRRSYPVLLHPRRLSQTAHRRAHPLSQLQNSKRWWEPGGVGRNRRIACK
jgi:hypothetical protein